MSNLSEKKICQNCKVDFVIEPEDFDFYKKMKVPPPSWCPNCRSARRLTYVGDRFFYKDICNMCGKNIVSLFNPDDNFTVYCNKCWWGDGWDPLDYGKDYNFSKTFFEQLHELQLAVPYQATDNRNCTNCDYCESVIRCKNCSFVFGGLQSINCFYCENAVFSCDTIDSDCIFNADHIYETIYSNGVYNSKFTYYSDECIDCAFLFNCIGCTNCFGCVNLRNQKYYIFNKKYSKEDYLEEIKKLDLGSYKIIEKVKQKFMELYLKTPRRFALIINSVNVTGDDIKNTKNCRNVFATRHGVENCKNVFTCGLLLKDSQDVVNGGDTSELFYENSSSLHSQRAMFSHSCNDSMDIEYSDRVFNCSNLFGCIMFKKRKYCILNKQYEKDEYFELVHKIRKHMDEMPYIDKKGRVYKYGEFFPPEHSLWAYNETWANQYFPITKEQAEEQGYNWRDPAEKNYKVTILPENLPDHISDVSDSILDEVIACEHATKKKGDSYEVGCNQQCATAFRILPDELQFYRQMNLALPHLCINCRYYERLKKVNVPKLYHRKCMCNETNLKNGKYQNTIKHFHGEGPCPNKFETAIADGREEIIYCEKCYQAEFI
jgi:hypothetical protein